MSEIRDESLWESGKRKIEWVAPPKLYDLTTLQRDANRLFGFTAKQTWNIRRAFMRKS